MKKIIIILLISLLVSLFATVALFLSCWIVIILFIVLFFIATNLIWTLLPLGIKSSFKNNRKRFVGIILPCLIFLFFGVVAFNHWLLPDLFHPISLLADAGILLFTIFLGWCLIKPGKKRVLSIGIIIFILFIYSLSIIVSKKQLHIMPSSLEKLKSLPYLTWVPAEKNIQKIGVTKYERSLSYEGFNIYNYDSSPLAYLIDMSGKILHTWSTGIDPWQHVEMCDNGDLLGVYQGVGLVRLDWDSRVRWEKKINAHHDVAIAKNKKIYTLDQRREIVFNHGFLMPIISDHIVVLSPDGIFDKEISLYQILKKEIPAVESAKHVLRLIAWKLICTKTNCAFPLNLNYYDFFHTNTIEIINRDIKGLCKEGDLLICALNLNLIGIVDIKNEKLIWSWGTGNLDSPHNPTLLENGNILIFDNGTNRGYSRIVELNPLTKNIVWEYKSNPPNQFYSANRGSCQRLPNGNTLITESTSAHVFEITREGEIVWEFYSPEVDIENKERRVIYRLVRIMDPEKYPFFKELK